MSITIAQVIINDSSDKTITGAYVFDRENGGSLSIPALNYFPTTPLAGELIWRIDENLIYRRNDLNTAWNSIYAQIDILNSTAGDIIYYNGTTWTRLPAGVVGQFLQTNGVGQAPNWEGITVPDGAVSGSGFSINNSIPRFNGIDGYSIKSSLVTIDDNGNILTPGTVDGYDLSLRFQSISESLAGIITDHGNLIGLSDDDHAQYLLASGLRSMSGNLNIGGYDIVNVNSIDGYNLELSFQNISNHISNISNPHNTTLANIGAGTLAQLNAAISDADVTPTTRSIISGNGLTGGGDLSADRTIAIAAADTTITVNADSIQVGVITDTNHGTRGGGTLHSVATTSVAGFESAADKTKLDQLVNNSHLITVSATQPTSPTTGDIWIDISGS
jgi:hypothetical protein